MENKKIKLFEVSYNSSDEKDYLVAYDASIAITGVFKEDLCDSLEDVKDVREVPESEYEKQTVEDFEGDFEPCSLKEIVDEYIEDGDGLADDFYEYIGSVNRGW